MSGTGAVSGTRATRRPVGVMAAALLAASLAAGVAGCASSGSTEIRTPVSPKLSSKRSAVVRVTSNVPKSEETTLELEGAIVERLRQARAFDQVYSKLSSQADLADVEIKVTILEFSGVSDLARALAGAFAGQAVIVAEVELREAGGDALGAAKVEGRSSGGTGFAGTTMQAVQKTAEQVAAFARAK